MNSGASRDQTAWDPCWDDCRADMLALTERRNEATDGSLHMGPST